jgi:hypothetical protein
MAEDAVTIGLRLDDWDKIGCVNHDCDQCKAVQEPVAWMQEDGEHFSIWKDKYATVPLYTTPPAAQQPWVDLTGEEIMAAPENLIACIAYVRNKLREKNAAAQPAPVQEHLPIAMKTHGAWDGLELLDDLPDGALLYTTTPPVAQPAVQGPLSFNCSAGCGACGVKLQDFVTRQTQAQEGDEWVVMETEPQIVSTCCGSPVEVWDERKQDITASVDATPPAPPAVPLTDLGTLQAIVDEYYAWIRHHAAGHDYDDFLLNQITHSITDAPEEKP